MNDSINGRNFLTQAGMSGVGLSMAGYFNPLAKASESPARKIGANDKITAAVIGTNGRGLAHIDCLTTTPDESEWPPLHKATIHKLLEISRLGYR